MTPPTRRFEYDDEDPFGSRPDEKPPEGWEAGFWDNVSHRIEEEKKEPGRERFPEPVRNNRLIPMLTAIIIAAAALLLLVEPVSAPSPTPHDEPAGALATVVHVDGSRDPDLAVEWARINGRQSGYVVLQSIDPEILYVLIDPRLSGPYVTVQ